MHHQSRHGPWHMRGDQPCSEEGALTSQITARFHPRPPPRRVLSGGRHPRRSWLSVSPAFPLIRFRLKSQLNAAREEDRRSLSPQLPLALGITQCPACQAGGNLSFPINQNTQRPVQAQADKPRSQTRSPPVTPEPQSPGPASRPTRRCPAALHRLPPRQVARALGQ